MADGSENAAVRARTLGSISGISAREWDALANPAGVPQNPFVSHAFLLALERSGSATEETGWTPRHIVIEEGGVAIGAAPLYLKAHSFGEYVFDHHWANACERAGMRYYPKLLSAPPFTPVPGPRLLAPKAEIRTALAHVILELCERLGASSAHVNFADAETSALLEASGFLTRCGFQYHWFNRGHDCYQDFLDALSSRKRKALKRERKEASAGLELRRLDGAAIGDRHWDAFWRFYQDTGGRKWGRPYLTREFFAEIATTMADRIMMVTAEHHGNPVAGALNFIGGDALYGRYWGRTGDLPFLHFEVCYHQAIEFAIERGLSRVEAGAQGEHKIARGYEPVLTYSSHWIAERGFRAAVARNLAAERIEISREMEAIRQLTPYRRSGETVEAN